MFLQEEAVEAAAWVEVVMVVEVEAEEDVEAAEGRRWKIILRRTRRAVYDVGKSTISCARYFHGTLMIQVNR